MTSHKGCLEKLDCNSNYNSNSNRNFDTNNDVLCDNFKGSCTDDSKRLVFSLFSWKFLGGIGC